MTGSKVLDWGKEALYPLTRGNVRRFQQGMAAGEIENS